MLTSLLLHWVILGYALMTLVAVAATPEEEDQRAPLTAAPEKEEWREGGVAGLQRSSTNSTQACSTNEEDRNMVTAAGRAKNGRSQGVGGEQHWRSSRSREEHDSNMCPPVSTISPFILLC